MAASVDERLAQTFVELADTLVVGFDLMEFLHTLTERSVELLGGTLLGCCSPMDAARCGWWQHRPSRLG